MKVLAKETMKVRIRMKGLAKETMKGRIRMKVLELRKL